MFRFLTRRWRLVLAFVLAAVTLASAGFWFQSWRAQREFEETVAMIVARGGKLTISETYPSWMDPLRRQLGPTYTRPLATRFLSVDLRQAELTKSDLRRIGGLSFLTELSLDEASGIDDESLAALRGARSLTCLRLNGTAVTDAGLQELSELPVLNQVELEDTAVTDSGVRYLMQMVVSRRDPIRRFICIKVNASEVQAVQLSELRVCHITGVAKLQVRGRVQVQGASMNGANVDFHMHHVTNPTYLGYCVGRVSPTRLVNGDYQFEMQTGMISNIPDPVVGTTVLVSKYPDAIVVYRLKRTKFLRSAETGFSVDE